MANPSLTDHQRGKAPPPPPLPPPPELIEDAVAEILLRVPPDEPADLVRASLVDKCWRRVLTDPSFLRRYREFHRTPPLLGFFHNNPPDDVGPMPLFVATTAASPFPQPEFGGKEWWAMNGHHGRVLIDVGADSGDGLVVWDLIVWDPITGDRHRIGRPGNLADTLYCPTVICAVSSCNHLNCHGGPFLVVGVGFVEGLIQVFAYSSEAHAWTQSASVDSQGVKYLDAQNGILIEDEIYFSLGWGDGILKYEADKNGLSVLDPPEVYDRGASLVQMEDGSLGLAGSKGSSIYLWSWMEPREGAAGWVLCRVIDFEKLLPSAKLFDTAQVIGFAEGLGLMFVGTFAGVFTIELKSGKLKRIGEPGVFYPIVPFMSFYTPDGKHALELPELNESAITEILLRIPPDEPAGLVRASLVHKCWRRILTDPAFLCRYREFHCTRPLLGFFHNHPPADVGSMPRFVATTGASPLPQPEFDGEDWWAMNCHHGCVLVDIGNSGEGLVVWDPITDNKHRIHRPDSLCGTFYSPAVLSALRCCNHLNRHGGPFLVVGVGFADSVIQVFVYTSEDRAWTQPASVDSQGINYVGAQKGTLIGDAIFFTLGWGDRILKYKVDKNRLSVFDPPEVYDRGASLVQMEDGSLGLAGSLGSSIYLWSRKETGFAEGLGLMFVGTFACVFTIELKSDKLKRIGEPGVFYPIIPFMSFYTPDCASSKLVLQAGTIPTQTSSLSRRHERVMAPPDLIDDAFAEILLRMPPDDPGHLVRAAAVCKLLLRILSDPGFWRRYREFHRPPFLLGFFRNTYHAGYGSIPRFVPTTMAANPFPLPHDGNPWWVADCRSAASSSPSITASTPCGTQSPVTGRSCHIHQSSVTRSTTLLQCYAPWLAAITATAGVVR
ncbi:hypothetical protein QOZ80_7AG0554060 [Eleusine coracana subsp. coracana]|nr:hypothetical protein QOZ80_7AG0554060 [Eleusine coracana subsp. coracana]